MDAIFYTGHYVYVDPKYYGIGAVAGLVSPDVTGAPEACVAFNHFTSHTNGKLQVWLHVEENPEPTLLQTLYAPFDAWIGARQVIFCYGNVYQDSYLDNYMKISLWQFI